MSAAAEASAAITAGAAMLAAAVTERHYAAAPERVARYGEAGRAKCLEDAGYHLAYLAQAIASGEPALFRDYVAWARAMLAGRKVSAQELARNLDVLREVLSAELPPGPAAIACEYVEAGLAALPALPDEPPPCIVEGAPNAALARTFLDALLAGERRRASGLVTDALESGVPLRDIYLQVFQPSQQELGRLWQMNRISVAQEHYATAATQFVMSQLYPRLFATPRNGLTLVATCVCGDLHEIGVRMVSDLFEIEGWNTFYLGANVPHDSVVRTLVERRADVLAVSATITPHVAQVRALIARVRAAEGCEGVRILVGGYPFNLAPGLWREVGADAGAGDALQALDVAARLAGRA